MLEKAQGLINGSWLLQFPAGILDDSSRRGAFLMRNSRQNLLIQVVFLGCAAFSIATQAQAQTFTEFPLPNANSSPRGITAGPDGNLWFAEANINKIGVITPGGVVTEFSSNFIYDPVAIVAGSDGALWFTEPLANGISRITTAGAVDHYTQFPTNNSNAFNIAAGPDGRLWVAESCNCANKIASITTSGVVTEYPLSNPGSAPYGIAAGADGSLWFTETLGGKIGRITTTGGLTEFTLPSTSPPWNIVAGPDGAMWFTFQSGAKIGRITASGIITEFALPTPFISTESIAAGPDGAMWFTDPSSARAIGRITMNGVITSFIYPSAAGVPRWITAGPDGAMWFTTGGPKIGRLSLPANQTVVFTSSAPASATVGGTPYTPVATATSGLTVALTIDATSSSICSISGGVVSFVGVGTCVIDANQAGSATYNPAPQVQQSFVVGKAAQTVSFTSSAPVSATVGGAPYTPVATSTSGLTAALTIDATSSSICSISGGVVSFVGVGTCVIDANQAGNTNYNAAPQVQQTFSVGKGSQTIAFASTAPSNAVVGGPTYTVAATATSGLAVAFTGATPSICTVAGSTVSFVATGACVINANQSGNGSYNAAPQVQQTVTVGQPASAHTWVSRNGSDSNPCTVAAPCQTFQAAHDLTGASGEINCLNSGDYGPLIISKSITIKCSGLMASIAAASGAGITIAAGAADKIVIDGLDIEGLSTGSVGISVGASSKVHVLNTTVRNFASQGIALNASNTHVFIDNSFVIGNPTGVFVSGTNNIASLTSSSVRASPTASLNAATASAIIGAQSSVINDSPVGIARAPGAQVISVGPSNLVTGAGTFTLTLPFE
jgi:streptogramin lyase